MTYLDFIHRKTKPTEPKKGVFYWVEDETKTEIWFSPSDKVDDLILLNEELKLKTVNGNKLEGTGDITISATLSEDDINTIAKKVSMTGLVWKIVE